MEQSQLGNNPAGAQSRAGEAGANLSAGLGGWISVEERLPNFVEASLYAIPFLVMRDGDRTPSIGYFYIGWDYPWSSAGTKAVTHWMPLPEAP